MKARARNLRWLALASVAVTVLACEQAAPKHPPTAARSLTWSVDGIRPGDRIEPHRERLGPPERTIPERRGGTCFVWQSPAVTVSVDPAGVIVAVWGRTLTAGERRLVRTGARQDEVETALGSGELERVTRPTSGVISLGRVEVGRSLGYDNGGLRFTIGLREDVVTSVCAMRAEPPH